MQFIEPAGYDSALMFFLRRKRINIEKMLTVGLKLYLKPKEFYWKMKNNVFHYFQYPGFNKVKA